ncbi:MAG: polysaccharide biosynthesis/export family protein [Sphingomonadaceae bacterium]|nr:polysaccharide biosynthesis/export family protein [Sphingomonadaceae bacterium]
MSTALASCGSSQLGGAGSASDVQVVDDGALPEPTRLDLFEQNRPYLIGPFDKLIIDVFGIEELSKQEVQADAGGRVPFFPLAARRAASVKPPWL